jgi:hypothetical protein
MTDDDKAYLSATLEEYKTLRDESKQASINMFAALQLGAGFVGVVLAAGITQWGRSAVISVAVFMVLVPLLATFSMFIWLGEAIRLKRAGDYLAFLEQKVGLLFSTSGAEPHLMKERVLILQQEAAAKLGLMNSPIALIDPLGWEQWLRNARSRATIFSTSGHQRLVYGVRLVFFPLITLVSYGIGLYYVVQHEIVGTDVLSLRIAYLLLAGLFGFLMIVVSIVFGILIARKLDAKAEPIHRDRLFAGTPNQPPNTAWREVLHLRVHSKGASDCVKTLRCQCGRYFRILMRVRRHTALPPETQ